eukprot:1972965-Amphidinium_carterae.2
MTLCLYGVHNGYRRLRSPTAKALLAPSLGFVHGLERVAGGMLVHVCPTSNLFLHQVRTRLLACAGGVAIPCGSVSVTCYAIAHKWAEIDRSGAPQSIQVRSQRHQF